MPSFGIDFSTPDKTVNRYRSAVNAKTAEYAEEHNSRKDSPDLTSEFDRAAAGEDGRGERDGGDDRGIRPHGRSRNQRNDRDRRRDNAKDNDRGR